MFIVECTYFCWYSVASWEIVVTVQTSHSIFIFKSNFIGSVSRNEAYPQIFSLYTHKSLSLYKRLCHKIFHPG